MQTSPRAFPFSGLIAVLGLLTLLVGLTIMIVLPSIRYAAWAILALGVILLGTAFILEFRQVSRALTGRRGRLGVGTTVMVSIFIGITLLVNAISVGNYQRFDFTGLAQFTLTSQTKDVLSKLETPVQTLCFFVPADPYGVTTYARSLLTEYQNYTDHLSVEFIDPDEHPDQARQYGITQYQTVVFESQNRHRLVLPQEIVEQAEHAFTSAILEVTGIVQKKVYFLTGHGESNIKSTASNGYSRARIGLLDNLYQVETLDLIYAPSIPEDCAALIIAAPQKSLTSSEIKIIEHYLESDGRALFLINPDPPPEIKQLLSPWGVEIEDGIVIDQESYVAPNKDIPLVTRERNMLALPEIYFPGATATIPQEEADENIELLPLVWTSKDSWLEKDFDPLEEPEFDEEIDRKGPLALGVLSTTIPLGEAEEESPEVAKGTILIVIGDSDFASNEHFYNGSNGDLFLNAVNLLAAGIEIISIERKVLPFRRLVAGPEVATFINYSSIGLLPVVVLIVGGIIWWRRR